MTNIVKGLSVRVDTREELDTLMKSEVFRGISAFYGWGNFESVDFDEQYLFIEIIADGTRIGVSLDANPNEDESSTLEDWSESFSYIAFPQQFLNILQEEEDYLITLKYTPAYMIMAEDK